MLILFVVLFVTHQVAGQLRCPQVAASLRDDLDISSFSVLLDQPEGIGDDGNASDDDQCKLISYSLQARLTVSYLVCIYIAILFLLSLDIVAIVS